MDDDTHALKGDGVREMGRVSGKAESGRTS